MPERVWGSGGEPFGRTCNHRGRCSAAVADVSEHGHPPANMAQAGSVTGRLHYSQAYLSVVQRRLALY